jgi:hypothetical protein
LPNNKYNRTEAVSYALKYALKPNPKYPYYKGDDCTNFISQCLQAGGCKNHFHTTHPWWCIDDKTSICWSVAASLYWYIKVCTEEKKFGIRAVTKSIKGNYNYSKSIADIIELGDIIQYMNYNNRIQHSVIITDFTIKNSIKHPLISQHTHGAINIPWTREFKKTIFHHIIGINEY